MMAKASFSETGQLLDSGLDLNMQDGIAEYAFLLLYFYTFTVLYFYLCKFNYLEENFKA